MPIIEVDHLTKEYRLGAMQGLKQTLLNSAARLTGKKAIERPLFKALDDVSFTIKQGEVVGIIGHNGAGKSTLLKMLAGISTPTTGAITVNGRIAPLIEVGAGFVPEFTGRENVYLNGTIMGLSRKEIEKKFDEIVAFAEMEEFIDTPVKRYSSGMQVKLAFSVATSIAAEILIVDEVLAVGDLAFQRKCFDRMETLIKREGRTVLLVSHNIRQVERLCSRVMLLKKGQIVADGETSHVCSLFYGESADDVLHTLEAKTASARVKTSGEVDITRVELSNADGEIVQQIRSGDALGIHIHLNISERIKQPEIVVGTHTTDFVYLTANTTAIFEERPDLEPGETIVECFLPKFPIAPGAYCIRVTIFDRFRRVIYDGETLKVFNVTARENEMREASLRLFDVNARWNIKGCELVSE